MGFAERTRRFGFAAMAWLGRRLTPLGATAAAGLLASAAMGFDTTRNMAHQLFTMLAALLAASGVASRLWRPRLSAERRPPRHATVGLPFPVGVTLTNRGASPERGVEAGMNGVSVPVPDLPPGGSASVTLSLVGERRGRLRLSPVLALKTDPLGLRRARRAVGPEGSVLVLPRRYPVPPSALPGLRRHQPGGVALASAVGESQEFVSLRDYRPGDPPRRIHWRSWAKAGRPIVKEHQDEHFVRHALALDTAGPAGPVFEEAVSVAASFAAGAAVPDALLDLLFIGDRAYCFTAGRGQGSSEHLLEVLAGVEARPGLPLEELAGSLSRRRASLSGCILVLLGLDAGRRALVRGLRASGLPVRAFAVVGAGAPAFEPEPGVRRLEVGRAAEALAAP